MSGTDSGEADHPQSLHYLQLSPPGMAGEAKDRPKGMRRLGMSVSQAWDRIEAWLAENAKKVVKSLRKPAKPAAIAKAEKELGVTFPVDFAASLARHDGQSETAESGLFPYPSEPAWRLLALEEILAIWKTMKELVDGGEFANRRSTPPRGVRNAWCHAGWIPVADNGAGDFVAIDTAPAPSGTAGQIILFNHDSPQRPRFAASFEVWLTKLADNMEAGRYVYDPSDWGLMEKESDEEESLS